MASFLGFNHFAEDNSNDAFVDKIHRDNSVVNERSAINFGIKTILDIPNLNLNTAGIKNNAGALDDEKNNLVETMRLVRLSKPLTFG